ncbi:helix-turn-helix transcriptional regulator [Paenibacillus larvae]
MSDRQDIDTIIGDVPAYAVPVIVEGPLSVKDFGKWLKALREENGLTLTQLGDKIGYSNPYLSQIETGKKKNMPSPELLEKLADPLCIDYSDLLFMAGYDDLANGVLMKEREEELSQLFSELDGRQNFIDGISDLKNLLKREVSPLPKYNGHRLTEQDRRRILGMLEILFPEYQNQKPLK